MEAVLIWKLNIGSENMSRHKCNMYCAAHRIEYSVYTVKKVCRELKKSGNCPKGYNEM